MLDFSTNFVIFLRINKLEFIINVIIEVDFY